MINFMLDICTTSSGLRVMFLLKTLMKGICIIVPIILMIVLMIDGIKAVTTKDDDAINLLKKKAIPKLIAAVIVFLVPTIVSLFMNILSVEKYKDCFGDVTIDQVKELERQEKEERENNDSNPEKPNVNPTPKPNNKNPEYTTSNSHTNSINNIKYVTYNQCTEPWGSKMFSTNTTVCAGGCPMISAAVIISAYDFNLTPLSIYNAGHKSHYIATIVDDMTPGAFSCSSVYPKTEDNILNELVDGDVIIMRRQKDPVNESGNHWMALIDVNKTERKVYVGNSMEAGNTPTTKHGWFNVSEIVINPQEVFVCKPSQTLINKFN